MTRERFRDGVLVERWDDETRTYTRYNAAGEVVEERPFTDIENAFADRIDSFPPPPGS